MFRESSSAWMVLTSWMDHIMASKVEMAVWMITHAFHHKHSK